MKKRKIPKFFLEKFFSIKVSELIRNKFMISKGLKIGVEKYISTDKASYDPIPSHQEREEHLLGDVV